MYMIAATDRNQTLILFLIDLIRLSLPVLCFEAVGVHAIVPIADVYDLLSE